MVKINNVILPPKDYVLVDGGEIQVAKKRVSEESKIYGANGTYVVHDGAYESQERVLKFSAVNFAKVVELSNLFNDFDNEIEFDYLKLSRYYADLVDITYSKQGKSRWIVNVKLRFNPFRYTTENTETKLTTRGTINNIGNVFSEPIIEIEGSGEVSLTIGVQSMFLNLDSKAIIDCRHRKQNVYDKNNVVKNSIRKKGGFFEIPPGLQGVATNGNVTNIKIKGNWRWRV
jgi:phage-related protein